MALSCRIASAMSSCDPFARRPTLTPPAEKRAGADGQELAELQVEINEEKSRIVDLCRGESFGFLGFDFRRVRSLQGRWRGRTPTPIRYTPSANPRNTIANATPAKEPRPSS